MGERNLKEKRRMQDLPLLGKFSFSVRKIRYDDVGSADLRKQASDVKECRTRSAGIVRWSSRKLTRSTVIYLLIADSPLWP